MFKSRSLPIGYQVNYLTVISEPFFVPKPLLHKPNLRVTAYRCRCDGLCGGTEIVRQANLLLNAKRPPISCGCTSIPKIVGLQERGNAIAIPNFYEKIYVYTLADPRAPYEIRYVGASSTPECRLKQHILSAGKSQTYTNRWITHVLKEGVQPSMTIIEEIPFEQWSVREKYWIGFYKNAGFKLTNSHPGGFGCASTTVRTENLNGKRFGKLMVVSNPCFVKITNDRQREAEYECICDCGKIRVVKSRYLKAKIVTSCGCSPKPKSQQIKIGQKFHRLTVISERFLVSRKSGKQQSCHLCKCDCGKETQVSAYSLFSGLAHSCGCYQQEIRGKSQKTHGETQTRLYTIWRAIYSRCYNKKQPSYSLYGGKGVGICEQWKHDYTAFRDWAKVNGYQDNLQINLINKTQNYSPENCQWSSCSEVSKCRPTTRFYTAFGETKCIKDWADDPRCPVPYMTLLSRFNRGVETEKAICTPAKGL